MSTSYYDAVVDGMRVGVAAFHETSMLWWAPVRATAGETRDALREPGCTDEAGHALAWADLSGHGDTFRLLYCATCRALVPPPADEYGDYEPYPPELVAKVLR